MTYHILSLVILYLISVETIDSQCLSGAYCADENSYCKKEYSSCTSGICSCFQGYTFTGIKCVLDVGYGSPCNSSYNCVYGTSCTNNRCECPAGRTYNSRLQKCVTTGQMEVGGVCSTLSECYQEVADSVTCSGGRCECKTGYAEENYRCRLPILSETCNIIVGCGADITETKQVKPTCSLLLCTCPDGAESFYVRDTSKTVCLEKNLKRDGEACDVHNECSSGLCRACPGSSDKTCIPGNAASTIAGTMTSLFVVFIMAAVQFKC